MAHPAEVKRQTNMRRAKNFDDALQDARAGLRSAEDTAAVAHHRVIIQVAENALVSTLDDAVEAAARRAEPGDVVLLSPAGTSFDAFPSFEARGTAFRTLVRSLPGFAAEEDA